MQKWRGWFGKFLKKVDVIAGTPIKEPEPEPVIQKTETSLSSKVWHYTAASITAVSSLLSYQAASSYNSLSDKNQDLANTYASTQSSSTKSEYESNQSRMKGFKSQVQTYDSISLVGLGWWAYLFFTDSKKFTAKNNERITYLMADQSQFKLEWKWKF